MTNIYNLNFTYPGTNYSLTPTDFSVAGDRLFVVLNEVNQIWVYSLSDTGPT